MRTLLIGELAKRAGVTAPTIRYYESIRLLNGTVRSNGGYRRYSERTLEQLRFIRKAQALGFSLSEVAEIQRLTRAGAAPCQRVFGLVRQHLATIDERIVELQNFRNHLAAELAKWGSRNDTMRDGVCQIIATSEMDSHPPASLGDRLKTRVRRAGRVRTSSEID